MKFPGRLRSSLAPSLSCSVLSFVALVSTLVTACGQSAAPADAGSQSSTSPAAATPAENRERIVRSALYDFTLTTHAGLVPPPDRPRAGGSIAAYGDGFLLVTAAGDFFRLWWAPENTTLRAERLPASVPFNRGALLDASNAELAAPFRITDLLVDEGEDAPRVFVAHHHWDAAADCVTLRVSSATLPLEPSGPAAHWETVFDSRPCLTVGEMWATGEAADRGGGRLAFDDEGGLLLSVGDYGFDGLDDRPAFPQESDVSYGKILSLDLAGGSRPFSIGHRNPQGLLVDSQQRVWSTEHGPEGGDELNLVVRGGNYGWPLATYGTAYDSDVWPLAADPRSHGRFREPAEAFVPAVGISQLLEVSAEYVPRWAGDLLVSSLQAAMLFRMHLVDDRVIYTEHLDVSMRVRDIAEGRDGRMVIWNDAGEVASLTLAQ